MALPIEHGVVLPRPLIEACLSHHAIFLKRNAFDSHTRRGLICAVFLDMPAEYQPGHQEIELALTRYTK